MKLEDLAGKSREEQSQLIEKQPEALLLDMLEEPEKMQGKILVFRGNYDGYATDGLCVRTFEYGESEGRWKDRWKVSDIDLSDMFTTLFDHGFSEHELKNQFKGFCSDIKGFLLEK